MKVRVRCFGSLRELVPPRGEVELDVAEGDTVAEVVAAIGVPSRAVHLVLLDGERADVATPVGPGSEIALMPPFSGGAGTC